jgi:alpha-glucosidase
MIIETPHLKTAVMEAGLEAFPALYFTSQSAVLTSVHPPYPLEEKVADNQFFLKKVTKSAEYIAKGSGPKSLPWRIFSFVKEDKDLLDNEMVYLLAPEAEGDFSWVKPGKVSWDWYNDNKQHRRGLV